MAAAPSWVAEAGASTPWKAPMGVRVAAAITTCVLSMKAPAIVRDAWVLVNRGHGGRDVCSWSIAATEAAIEHINEPIRDLMRIQGRVFAIPVAHPVERAGEGEGGHFGVAVANGTVVDARGDERAHAPVDTCLQLLDAPAEACAEILILGAQHAPSEVADNGRGVATDECEQPFARGALGRFAVVERCLNFVEARTETFEEHGLLVGHVQVKSGLGDAEVRGDAVQRGVVIPAGAKRTRRREDDSLALEGVVLLGAPARLPRRCCGARTGGSGAGGAPGGIAGGGCGHRKAGS